MKQTLLLSLYAVFTTALHAQSPTLTSTINYAIGDKQITLVADTVGIVPGPAGANQVWDFSKLKQDSAKDSTFIKYIDPKKTAYNGDFKTATIAGESAVPHGISYTFFSMTNAGIVNLGDASYDSTSTNSNVVEYLTTFTQLTFPVQYGYVHSGTYKTPLAGKGANNIRGIYNIKADAYGSMKIRNTQYDSVIRLNVFHLEVDSVDLGPFAIITYDSSTSYMYYCPGKKSPIITISYSPKAPHNKKVTFNDFDHVHTASVASEKDENISFSLFPNPTKGIVGIYLSVKQASESEIMISNELGQVVKSIHKVVLEDGANHLDLDLHGMPPGIYFVNLISNGQTGRQKLVVE